VSSINHWMIYTDCSIELCVNLHRWQSLQIWNARQPLTSSGLGSFVGAVVIEFIGADVKMVSLKLANVNEDTNVLVMPAAATKYKRITSKEPGRRRRFRLTEI
jgi:hypothetical protein